MYQRYEDDSVRAFYELHADWSAQTPTEITELARLLAKATKLPRTAREYPVDSETLYVAAHALVRSVHDVFNFSLNLKTDDAGQLDRLAERHLIDPALRSFFRETGFEELSEERAEAYFKASEDLRVPKEPLLFYCLGAFWGEWMVLHRRAVWALYPPLNPVQSFPDLIGVGPTVCSHPFSQVCKKMTDPEGDNLSFKVQVFAGNRRYLPPFPMIASLADAEQATKDLLPEAARRAEVAAEAGDDETAWLLLCEASKEHRDHPQVLAKLISCAWRLKKWDMVDGGSQRLLELVPDHPVTCYNLAVLYGGTPDLVPDAIDLLERAIRSDPYYGRAHLTIATLLAEGGRLDEAQAHAHWIVENDSRLKQEAEDLLERLGSG